jgi:hypothetical protein
MFKNNPDPAINVNSGIGFGQENNIFGSSTLLQIVIYPTESTRRYIVQCVKAIREQPMLILLQ